MRCHLNSHHAAGEARPAVQPLRACTQPPSASQEWNRQRRLDKRTAREKTDDQCPPSSENDSGRDHIDPACNAFMASSAVSQVMILTPPPYWNKDMICKPISRLGSGIIRA